MDEVRSRAIQARGKHLNSLQQLKDRTHVWRRHLRWAADRPRGEQPPEADTAGCDKGWCKRQQAMLNAHRQASYRQGVNAPPTEHTHISSHVEIPQQGRLRLVWHVGHPDGAINHPNAKGPEQAVSWIGCAHVRPISIVGPVPGLATQQRSAAPVAAAGQHGQTMISVLQLVGLPASGVQHGTACGCPVRAVHLFMIACSLPVV